jgi:cysteine dioxygenase
MGLHKVGNPTDSVSVTLHLYSPPFQSCRVWLDPTNAKDIQKPTITFNSRFGELTEF